MTKQTKTVLIMWTLFVGIIYNTLLFSALIRINYLGVFGSMPDLEMMENPKNNLASEVYSSDGVFMGKYFRENRSPVKYTEISPNVVNALVVTEDLRFEEHSGIDLKASFAILWYLAKGDQRGSSTLTQQLAKNLYKTRRTGSKGILGYIPVVNTIVAKIKEWELAIALESKYTKKEIITLYLNTVDFGSMAFGIKVASQTFFNKSQDSLSVPQAATLIGLLKAPTWYSPVYHPDNSIRRRNTVMELMRDNKYITDAEYKSFKTQPLKLDYEVEKNTDGIAGYFRTILSKHLQEWCKKNGYDLYSDGLKIYTTIDYKMQLYAEEAMREHMSDLQRRFNQYWDKEEPWRYKNKEVIPNFIEDAAKRTDRYKSLVEYYGEGNDSVKIVMNTKVPMQIFSWNGPIDTMMSPMDSIRYYKHFLHTGFMTMEPQTGYIKTWVGGIDFKFFKYDHVQQSNRQPGSAFKPFVYSAAVSNGIAPCTLIPDAPITFEYDEDGKHIIWTPKNADWVYSYDSLNLRQAMARSINTVAARLMKMVGPDKVAEHAHQLGIKSKLNPVPSLCLGSSDVNVYEMVGAYGTFVNKGIWTEPIFIERIEDHNGNVLYTTIPNTKAVLTEDQAAVMVNLLKGGTEERGGTSQALFQYDIFRGNEIGGKTGTTSNYSDGWFMGVTTKLVGGVWVGGEDRCIHFKNSATGEGSKVALPIFGKFLEKVYADPELKDMKSGYFKMPSKMSINIHCPVRAVKDRMDSLSLIENDSLAPIIEEEDIY